MQCCNIQCKLAKVHDHEHDATNMLFFGQAIKPSLDETQFRNLGSVCFDFKLIPEMIFQKIGCLVVTSNLVKLKSISSWPKIRAKTTENDFRFHFHFKWFPALENRRERERKSKKIADVGARRSHRSKTISPLRSFKPTLVEPSHWSSRSSRHFRTTHEERDRESREIVTPLARLSRHHSRTRSHQIADESTRTAPIASASHTANPRTRDRSTTNRESHHANRTGKSHHEPITNSFSFSFEILVINFFCNFDFLLSLWSLILLLLLLWWRGWWCFGGFPVVWWWVLWGWWWKIAFSECYQTHEIIF